jgi:hypothetical protein
MPGVSNELKSWPNEAEVEAVLAELRRQLDVVKALIEEHRRQMHAAGLVADPGGPRASAT